jgi:hypothetical protein
LPGQQQNNTRVTSDELRLFESLQYVQMKNIKFGAEIGVGQGGNFLFSIRHKTTNDSSRPKFSENALVSVSINEVLT